MEDTLRDTIINHIVNVKMSLNPCSNGRYSQSKPGLRSLISKGVLILVLMEDTLREVDKTDLKSVNQ